MTDLEKDEDSLINGHAQRAEGTQLTRSALKELFELVPVEYPQFTTDGPDQLLAL